MKTGRTALYRCYDDADGLLYIGVSWSFGVRWQKHANTQPWWGDVRRQTVQWYDTRDEALDAEALAIFNEQPRHNVLHRSQAQRLKSIQRRTRPTATPKVVPLEPGWKQVPQEELPPGVSSMRLGPGVTQELLDQMDAIDRTFENAPPSDLRCYAVDWES